MSVCLSAATDSRRSDASWVQSFAAMVMRPGVIRVGTGCVMGGGLSGVVCCGSSPAVAGVGMFAVAGLLVVMADERDPGRGWWRD